MSTRNKVSSKSNVNNSCKFLAILVIVFYLWMGPAVNVIQVQSLKNNRTILYQRFCPTNLYSIHYIQKRKIGKKETSNFLARYTYGNKQEKGIINVHVNIRSLKYKVQEVKKIILDKSPHIFGLSETELTKSGTDVNQLKVPGYDLLFPKSWESEGKARVIVYVKKTFKYEQISDLENEYIQSIWIRGSFKNCKNIYFCHAYREHMNQLPLENHEIDWKTSLISGKQHLNMVIQVV